MELFQRAGSVAICENKNTFVSELKEREKRRESRK